MPGGYKRFRLIAAFLYPENPTLGVGFSGYKNPFGSDASERIMLVSMSENGIGMPLAPMKKFPKTKRIFAQHVE